MRLVLNLASALASIVAAAFWWCASRRPAPGAFDLTFSGELDQALQDWVRTSAQANKRAATAAAVAAVFQGFAIYST